VTRRDKDRSVCWGHGWRRRSEKDENKNGDLKIKRKIKESFKVDGFIAFWGHVKEFHIKSRSSK
jgi:hypothetical protein